MQRQAMHSLAWQEMLELPEIEWDLCHAALLIAARFDAHVDVRQALLTLDELALPLVGQCNTGADTIARLELLNDYFAVQLGFHGDTQDFYQPDNSFLHKVIERRSGIPLSLSLIYLRLARAIGLDAYGIGFPGHFLVGVANGSQQRVIDPFNAAQQLPRDELMARLRNHAATDVDERMLRKALRPITPRAILVRMLRNLKQIYMEKQDVENALACIEMILSLLPESPDELRDRGMIYQHIEYAQGAVADLKRYLELMPDSDERGVIEAVIQSLDTQASPLH